MAPHIVRYLEDPPDAETLRSLLAALQMPARALLRTGEAVYKELGLADPALSEADVIDAMVRHPILIERPIVLSGKRAVLGRPPENVLELL